MREPTRVQPRFSIVFTLPIMSPRFISIDGLPGSTFEWELQSACFRTKTPEKWYKGVIGDSPFRGKMLMLSYSLTRVAEEQGVDTTLITEVTLQGRDNEFNRIYGKPNFRVSPDDVDRFLRHALRIGFVKALQERVPDWKP